MAYRDPEKKRAAAKRYRERHKERELKRVRESVARWRKANPGKHNANMRERYWADPDAARARNRAWYAANTEKVLESNRAWRQANRATLREYERWQAHQRRNAPLDRDYARVLLRDPCCYCGQRGGEVDHIDPVIRGGKGNWVNLTSACRSCNASKHDRPLLLFLRDHVHLGIEKR